MFCKNNTLEDVILRQSYKHGTNGISFRAKKKNILEQLLRETSMWAASV